MNWLNIEIGQSKQNKKEQQINSEWSASVILLSPYIPEQRIYLKHLNWEEK